MKPKPTLNQTDIQIISEVIDSRLEAKSEEILDRKLKEHVGNLPTKTEFYSRMDALTAEIKDYREEVIIVAGYKDQIDDHEDRLTHIETRLHV